jgi:Taurine catabolism dioxygenase TauD, TfdA family
MVSKKKVVTFILTLGFPLVGLGLLYLGVKDNGDPFLSSIGATLFSLGAINFVQEYLLHKEYEKTVLRAVSETCGTEAKNVREAGVSDYLPQYSEEKDLKELVDFALSHMRISPAKKDRAPPRLIICKTFIPSRESVESNIARFLDESGEKDGYVEILLLDPKSPIAVYRSWDLDEQSNYMKRRIEQDFNHLLGLKKKFDHRLMIRTYRAIPTLSLFGSDYQLLVGWYWQDRLAFKGPVMKVTKVVGSESSLFEKVIENFELLWERSDDYLPMATTQKLDCRNSKQGIKLTDDDRDVLKGFISDNNASAKEIKIDLLKKKLFTKINAQQLFGNLACTIEEKIKEFGFVWVKDAFQNDLTQEERRILFLGLITQMGSPKAHRQGHYDYIMEFRVIIDYPGLISTYSHTNHDAELHTDSHYYVNRDPEQYMGLLMEHPACCGGGMSTILSAAEVISNVKEGDMNYYKILKEEKLPCAIPSLYQGGGDECAFSEIILGDKEMRFRPDLINEGFERWRPTQSGEIARRQRQLKAFSYLRHAINTHRSRLSVALGKNDMLFTDNYRVLHGRTRFNDRDRRVVRIRYMGKGN